MDNKTSPTRARRIPKTLRFKSAGTATPDCYLDTTPLPPAQTNTADPGAEAQMLEAPINAASDTNASPALADHGSEELDQTNDTHAKPSKLNSVVNLLRRPGGASLAELCAATGWQVHSVRGAMAGALKRKGHIISSEKVVGTRRYRIGAAS